MAQKLRQLRYTLRLLAPTLARVFYGKYGCLMTSKMRVAGFLLLLLGVVLKSWTPLLLFVLAMLCNDYLKVRNQLERDK